MYIEKVVIAYYYQPFTAASNRIFAYAKGFAEAGKEVYLLLGDENKADVPIINGVNVVMVPIEKHGKLVRSLAKAVKEYYKSEKTAIFIYGSPSLCWYLHKSKYNIFYECTEIPFYGREKKIVSIIKEKIKLLLARKATGMFVISKALKNYFSEKGIKNITIINMFVDVGRFKEKGSCEKKKYIAYCGTISPFKDGVDSLIKAFAIFAASHDDYRLKIIGGFESYEAENTLKKLVDYQKIGDKVDFTGVVKSSEMPVLLCGAHMLALARPDNEQAKYGFPTKLGEYLATGKPVVVTNVGEIGCFLKDGENCRMANPDDEVDFADKMSWVADHYDEAIKLGEKGKELTKKEFSSVEQAKVALAFMENIIIKQRRKKNGI